MGELTAAAVGLGLAGLDPAGALIAAAALASGARGRSVVAYGLIALIGTVIVGSTLSLTVGPQLAQIDWLALLPTGPVGAWIELGLGVVLLVWALVRLFRPAAHAPKPQKARAGAVGLMVTGLVFALSAVLDPTFVAVTVLAGRHPDVVAVLVAQVVWVVISQAPLVFLLVAVARGGHQTAVAWFSRSWDRLRPGLRWVLTIVLFLMAALLILDAAWWFVTGRFLVFEP